MKSRVSKKLKSNSGASITFALLLFLVCAALSAVTLVAATTAAGRIAGIAETDQRYYSVTSATEFVRDLVDGKTVTVVKFEDGTRHFDKPADGIIGSDFKTTEMTAPNVDEAAEDLVAGIESETTDGSMGAIEEKKFVYDLADIASAIATQTSWNITSFSKPDLNVTVKGKSNGSNKIIVDVFNTKGKSYTMLIDIEVQVQDFTSKIQAINNGVADAREVTLHVRNIQSLYDAGSDKTDASGE